MNLLKRIMGPSSDLISSMHLDFLRFFLGHLYGLGFRSEVV